MTNNAWENWQAGSMRDVYSDDNAHAHPPAKVSLRDALSGMDRVLFDLIDEIVSEALAEEIAVFDSMCLSGSGVGV